MKSSTPLLRRISWIIPALLSISVVSGCFLDFDEFELPPVDDAGQNGADASDDADHRDGAFDDAGDTDFVDPGEPGSVGSVCEENADCDGAAICMSAVCLTPCQSDAECPSFAACMQIGADSYCAPRCTDTQSCDHFDFRDDLSCTYVVQTAQFGASPHQLQRACLPDADADGVFDGVDNCPDEPNPAQSDATGDGIGDACSQTPLCHVDADDGVLDFDPIGFRAGKFTIPDVIDGRWLPLLGTVDEEGAPESTLKLLDRHSGEWHDGGSLRFAGPNRHIVADNLGGWVVTPGAVDDLGTQIGAWTSIAPDGEISYLRDYAYSGSYPPMTAPFRFVNGAMQRLRIHTVQSTPDDGSTLVYFYLHHTDANLTESSSATLINTLSATGLDHPDNWSYHQFAHPDDSHGIAIWRPTERSIALIDISGPVGAPARRLQQTNLAIPDEWDHGDSDTDPPAEDIEDLSDFDPVFLPAPGGQLYLFDRTTGRAGRFLSTRGESPLNNRSWGSFERIPEFDLTDLDDFESFSVYVLPKATGLGLVGRPVDDPDSILVREIYLPCHPVAEALDTDGDGIIDIIDSCPTISNPGQEDLDGDSWGDACDPDLDGDAIANSLDIEEIDTGETDAEGLPILEILDRSYDSTNNGTININSEDSDGDSIPDSVDPFPLDSSNNGTPNRWTSDASGNGFTDNSLRTHDLDPYNFFSLPTGRNFAYLTEDESGQRTLHHGLVSDASQATAISLPDGINPHQLSFGMTDNLLVFLADAPEQTQRFLVYDLDAQQIIIEQSVYATLRSVFMVNATTFIAIHEVEDSDTWRVSQITVDPSFSRTEIFGTFSHIWYASLTGPNLLSILAADTDCRECASIYRYQVLTGSLVAPLSTQLTLLSDSTLGTTTVQAHSNMITASFPASDATSTREVANYRSGGQILGSRVAIPDEFDQIYSLTFSRRHLSSQNPSSTSIPFNMAAMSRYGQSPDIWITGPGLSPNWHLLLATDEPIVEAVWSP